MDQQPLVKKVNTMTMAWCLDCHRHPEKYIRPKEAVYKMGYRPNEPQAVIGKALGQGV
jgi:hypothetical protein